MNWTISKTGRIGLFHYRTAAGWVGCKAHRLVSINGSAAAVTEDEARATFERFINAQNAHDVEAVKSLLIDSPQFLWITRGTPVWGTDAALERFASLYEGTWRLEPEASGFRIMMIGEGVAQIFVPITFTIGAPDEQAKPMRFLMNMILTETSGGWKISSILPIPAPAP